MNEVQFAKYQKNTRTQEYELLLKNVQENQNRLFWQINNNTEIPSIKETAKHILRNFIIDTDVSLNDAKIDEFAAELYDDIFEQSILTSPLNDIWVEKITINAWDDVYIHFINGKLIKIDSFYSPQHAKAVIHGILKESQIDSDPLLSVVNTKLNNNIRITAAFPPIVSEETGVCCFIQKLQKRKFALQDYVTGDFASKDELSFLTEALQHRISILLVGNSGVGKTTLMEYLISALPQNLRILSIDYKTRELDIGTNLLLNDSPSEKFMNLVSGLNPDIIAYNVDSCSVQEVCLNGYAVIASVIAQSPTVGLRRCAHQWQKYQSEMDYPMALELTCSAFPLVVTIHICADKKRRITNLSECIIKDGEVHLKTLWEYQIQESTHNETGVEVCGRHKKTANISDALLCQMKTFGLSMEEMKQIKMEEDNYVRSQSNWQTDSGSTDPHN